MYSIESLSIQGYRGRPVQNTFFRQEQTKDLAVVFPGLGYRCYGPVIYYPTLVLLSLGSDVLWVEYAYDREPGYHRVPAEERKEWRLSDARPALGKAMGQRNYGRFTLVGKSIGTLLLGDLLAEEPKLRAARAVWLTPLLKNERLRSQLAQVNNLSLFVSGSADPEHDAEFADNLKRKSTNRFLLLKGADHSLEVRGDALQSLEMLRQLTEKTLDFLKD